MVNASDDVRTTACPPHSELADFDRGLLPESDIERVAAHLESGCAVCDSVLDGLTAAEDELTNHLALTVCGNGEGHGDNPIPTKIGRYLIESEIGRGGMGIVYRAFDPKVRRVVALKRVAGSMLVHTTAIDRFQKETEALGKIDHPNVVRLFDCGIDHDIPFFVFEFIAGSSLDEYTHHQSLLPPRKAAEIVQTIATAIHACHEAGVLHRDIKPANVLLTAHLDPVVTDFGLAKDFQQSDSSLTRIGEGMGTPHFIAPEQASGDSRRIGPASDVYSIGATLYTLLTGRPPIEGTSPLDLLDRVGKQIPEPPSRIQADVPRDLDTICLKCLEKDPAQRYASAQALATDLNHFLESRPIVARRTGPAGRAWKWSRRNPSYAIGGAILFLLIAGLIWQRIQAYTDQLEIAASRQLTDATNRLRNLEGYYYAIRNANFEWERNRLDKAERALASCPLEFRNIEWAILAKNCVNQELFRITNRQRSASDSPNDPFVGMEWAPDRNILAVWTESELTLWHIQDQSSSELSRCSVSGLACLDWAGNRVAALHRESDTIQLIKLKDGSIEAHLSAEHADFPFVNAPAIDPQGHWLVAQTRQQVFLFDLRDNQLAGTWTRGFSSNSGTQFLPDVPQMLSLSRGSSQTPSFSAVEVFELPSGQSQGSFSNPANLDWIGCSALDRSGQWLATGKNSDPRTALPGILGLWNIDKRRLESHVVAHDGGVTSVTFHPSRPILVTAGLDSCVYCWDFDEHGHLNTRSSRKFRAHGQVRSAGISADGKYLAVQDESRVCLYRFDDPGGPTLLQCHPDSGVFATAIHPDGSVVATGGSAGKVMLSDRVSGQPIRELKGMEDDTDFAVLGLAFSPDGKRLAAVGMGVENHGIIWDIETGTPVADLPLKSDGKSLVYQTAVAFDPTGSTLVTAGRENFVKIWDGVTGELRSTHRINLDRVSDLAFSPDGRLGIAGHTIDELSELPMHHVLIVDPSKWAIQTRLAHPCQPERIAFSTDPIGEAIAIGGKTGTIAVCDSRSGAVLTEMSGHDKWIKSLCFHPGRNRLISCSDDKTIRIWDRESGRELLARYDHPGAVESLSLSPDGKTLVSGGWGNTALIWDIDTSIDR